MTLTICSPHCGVAPETTSGGETYEREMLTRLGQGGVRVELILARGKAHPANVPNWTVHRFGIHRGLRWYVAPFVVPPAIRRVYRERGFDLLRVHSLRYIGPAALWARRRYSIDVPVVSHHHHLDPSPLNRVIEKRVIEASDHVITVSQFSRGQLADELGVSVDHVSVIHNGVDERFAPDKPDAALAARLGLGGNRVAMFLGGLKRRKNLEFLLHVWRGVTNRVPDATLLIAGDGSEARALKRAAVDLGISQRVVFSGRIPEEIKVAVYNLASVFVSPSSLEGFGFTVAEAMSCALPVVVARQGALPEIVGDGPGGVVCDVDRYDQFTDALVGLLRSPERCAIGGRANQARINAFFRWERAVCRVQEVYADVVGRRPRARPPLGRGNES